MSLFHCQHFSWLFLENLGLNRVINRLLRLSLNNHFVQLDYFDFLWNNSVLYFLILNWILFFMNNVLRLELWYNPSIFWDIFVCIDNFVVNLCCLGLLFSCIFFRFSLLFQMLFFQLFFHFLFFLLFFGWLLLILGVTLRLFINLHHPLEASETLVFGFESLYSYR